VNATEALAYYGFQPSCSCNHTLEQHADGRRCQDQDSYELPCACPSYFAEADQVAG
jgi:hypothetical protein